jgi:hypothetical protein
MATTKLHFGGIPTDIDIKKLRDAFPESRMKAGDKFTYGEIEALLMIQRSDNRFKTVTNRWRNIIERSTGIRIAAMGNNSGDGFFKVLSEPEKLQAVESKRKSVVKQTRKNLLRTAWIDRGALNDDEKKRLDHEALNSKNIIANQQLRRQIELPAM